MTKQLVPYDPQRCQVEKIESTPFRLGGPSRTVTRCANKPIVIAVEIAVEKEAGSDGQRGSMSICCECLGVMFNDKKQELPAMGFRNVTT